MIIILNPRSGGGAALRKWRLIERRILADTEVKFVITSSAAEAETATQKQIDSGEREFIAAGGDGTINALLQTLMRNSALHPGLALGAIGLGSSNDFHKPFLGKRMERRIPLAMEFANPTPRDVGVLRYTSPDGTELTKYWLLNASVGITAEANAFFNLESQNHLLGCAKWLHTNAAIYYAAVRTILRYRNCQLQYGLPGSYHTSRITNLGIVKTPHFAGSFMYDSPFEAGSGSFFAHHVSDLGLVQTLRLLHGLSNGKFEGFPNSGSFSGEELRIEGAEEFAVEFDGEVIRTIRAHFSILKQQILVAS